MGYRRRPPVPLNEPSDALPTAAPRPARVRLGATPLVPGDCRLKSRYRAWSRCVITPTFPPKPSRPGYELNMAPNRFLGIYMNDQLASGLVFREVAHRAARENAGTEVGDSIARVATAIAQDIQTFKRLMERLGLRQSRVKPRLAIAAER